MKNVKDTLVELSNYIHATRRVGHTTTMIRGAQNVDKAIIIVRNQHSANHLKKAYFYKDTDHDVISLASIKASALCGKKKPLAIDNDALMQLCDAAVARIAQLEAKIDELQ